MIIRFPYSYKYKTFNDSPLATKVDKFIHNVPIVFVVMALINVFFTILYYYPTTIHSCPKLISNTFMVFVIVFSVGGFIFPFLAGFLFDKLHISEKIAIWDLAGRKKSKKMLIPIAVIAFMIILPITVIMLCAGFDASYNTKMQSIGTSTVVKGNKVVSYIDGEYSTKFIPEDLQAREPEDVRYIVYYYDGSDLVGTYSNNSYGYQKWKDIEIVDRLEGISIVTKRFMGGYPPISVDDSSKSAYYGSDIDEKEVELWISEVHASLQ